MTNAETTGMPPRPVVLAVEDDPSVRRTMCLALTAMGFVAIGAESVDVALQKLGTHHVDAIVLDVQLPDSSGQQRSGFSLLRYLRSTPDYKHVPILIFTGLPLSIADENVARTFAAEVLYKPQPYSVLMNHLSAMLGPPPATYGNGLKTPWFGETS